MCTVARAHFCRMSDLLSYLGDISNLFGIQLCYFIIFRSSCSYYFLKYLCSEIGFLALGPLTSFRLDASSKGWGIPHDRSCASILLTYLFVTS